MDIKNKTALVTGGARRLGFAIAESLAARGVNLIIHYNRSRAEALAAERALGEKYGVSVKLFQADFCDIEKLEAKTRKLVSEEAIDILINNASSFYKTPFGTVSLEAWDDLIKSNLTGPFFLTQIIGSAMIKASGGKIINIADWSATRPYKDYLPYSIAKAGVITLTQILAKTLAPSVQVNAISPGTVLFSEQFSAEIERTIINRTPLKRIGEPEDIVRAVLFFLEGTDFATGANLVIDGGQFIL